MKQVRFPDKPLMDLQENAVVAVTQLQQQGIAESKLLTVKLPTVVGLDFNLPHSFGRPIKGYVLARIPNLTWVALGAGIVIYDSPTTNPAPNSIAIVRCNAQSPTIGQALSIGIIVF
jgi:hypothetical protein